MVFTPNPKGLGTPMSRTVQETPARRAAASLAATGSELFSESRSRGSLLLSTKLTLTTASE